MPVSLQRRTVGAYGDNILDTFLEAVTLGCYSLATYSVPYATSIPLSEMFR